MCTPSYMAIWAQIMLAHRVAVDKARTRAHLFPLTFRAVSHPILHDAGKAVLRAGQCPVP